MKKIIYLTAITIVLYSCGGKQEQSVESTIASQDINAIRNLKSSLSEKQIALDLDMKQLDSVIAILDSNEKLPLVTTVVAKESVFNHFLELQGNVKTKQNVLIYPETSGTLQRVYVKEGQKVKKGQILASIDDGGMASQLQQLKTQAELAKTTFDRQKRLWEQKIGSEIQYLQAKTNYESSESAVKQAQSMFSKSTIRAPFSGVIDNVIKDQGTVVAPGPGSEVFRIVNLSNMYIEVDVPETHLNNIKKGKEAIVYFPVLGDTVLTKVRQTGNFINPSNRSFSVEIPVENKTGNIKPNLTAKVNLNDYSKDNAILIPQSIISENAEGQQYVYVAEQNGENKAKATKRIINTGKTQEGLVEIVSGITKGEHLIKEGARNVNDGQNVQILNE
ncbi:RND family efflux transporter MFP subunit [Maribacter vaceletii]|uniref:RND family efflux transporter MFP subunit n=1 Tax=Maribacter vaceletii TaxID=1206816 RepID=A0A495ECI8_9FLAO|nr:efflux RND transporter periplasmic adaptor subunit [Maribacter vaceletii]RKR14594.1 RND family efflux transporter MFP subunit [Maribacter vaceletii]